MSVEQFRRGLAEAWIIVVPPIDGSTVQALMDAVPGLSRADREILLLAKARGEDLFTDENLLARAAAAQNVSVLDVVDLLFLLKELGVLNAESLKQVIVDMHLADRTFSRADLDALGCPGLF